MRYAAIDIGSNAIRLLIAEIVRNAKFTEYKKDTLIRVPLRLGDDAFLRGTISEPKAAELMKTMQAFRNLMDVYHVVDYKACATSAMREAANGTELAMQIKRVGIDLSIIDGATEAEIIYTSRLERHMDPETTYLYIDVGGGSTELSFFHQGQLLASRSFNLGTIRMLGHRDKQDDWAEMKWWLENHSAGKQVKAIGTGGNINKLFSLSGEKEGRALSYTKLQHQYQYLSSFTLEERISVLGLKADRADVIIPAARLFLEVMKWSHARQIIIPRLGLVDGMIQTLIQKNALL